MHPAAKIDAHVSVAVVLHHEHQALPHVTVMAIHDEARDPQSTILTHEQRHGAQRTRPEPEEGTR